MNRLTGEQTTKGVIKIMEDGLFKGEIRRVYDLTSTDELAG